MKQCGSVYKPNPNLGTDSSLLPKVVNCKITPEFSNTCDGLHFRKWFNFLYNSSILKFCLLNFLTNNFTSFIKSKLHEEDLQIL